MKTGKPFTWCLILVVLGLFRAASWCDGVESGDVPYEVGETLRYSIHIAGFRVGIQTVTIASLEKVNGREVYRIRGVTETKGLSKLFHDYRELCTVFVDASTHYPVLIERNVEDKGRVFAYTYVIDQEGRTVVVHNVSTGETKAVHPCNAVFEQLSLFYFYRNNPGLFAGCYSFDFIKNESVVTVTMREEGLVRVRIPKLSSLEGSPAYRYAEEGGDGIEVYVGVDGFSIPIKIVFRSAVDEKHKKSVIELYLRDYAAGSARSVPVWYRELVRRDS